MGMVILALAVILEVVFAAYCIFTKSAHTKGRNLIRIVSFAVFVIFTLLSIIEFSFRYYFLAILLLTLAIIGTVSLIRRKENIKEYKTKRIIIKAVAMVMLFLFASFPAILMPQYKLIEATGEYKVSTATYTYNDENRVDTYATDNQKRKVNVEFWYPENAEGTFPLVVFSHGMFGVKLSNESLFRELASYGYVVCSIDHPYQSFYTKDQDGEITIVDNGYLEEYRDCSNTEDAQKCYEYFKKWMDLRTGDMNFVIDTIKNLAGSKDEVYQLVDTNKIGVCGHSMGGSAALGLGRERDDVSAVMALESPYFGDILGVEDGKYVLNEDTYPLPVLNIYSDSTWEKFDKNSVYAQNSNLLTDTAAQAFNVYIKGAKHMSLTDLALLSPPLAGMLDGGKAEVDEYHCLETINRVTLDFFNCFLKGEGEFNSKGTY